MVMKRTWPAVIEESPTAFGRELKNRLLADMLAFPHYFCSDEFVSKDQFWNTIAFRVADRAGQIAAAIDRDLRRGSQRVKGNRR